VAIVDYGMGNVASVQKALNFLNIKSTVTREKSIISESAAIVLPGVGSFAQGMSNLYKFNLVELLSEEVLTKNKPFFGICLGMQLIMERGNEPHYCRGLGWIQGEVIKLDSEKLSVPHMGWNNIEIRNNKYFHDIENLDFYFIHSYHVKPLESSCVSATVNYGQEIVACIEKGNIFATQFHPEKSQLSGLKLLNNFFDIHVEG